MNFWYYFKVIIDNAYKIMSYKITLGNYSFSFFSVYVLSILLGLCFFAVGRLFK